ncbi:hypothetical protein [Virgibacillus sediminis]|uniref:SpoVT-AbrB domain-containing protein n=1 Tax=Virgibacillus sediminis TaxID=202260 RepID=A0ABV7A7X9_9BACI
MATIQTLNDRYMTNVCVEGEYGRIYLPGNVRTQIDVGERVELVWLNRVGKGAVYAYY